MSEMKLWLENWKVVYVLGKYAPAFLENFNDILKLWQISFTTDDFFVIFP